jgi:hypothetical protein
MTKVTIDSFDTEEQAVAFVDWMRKQFDLSRCRLYTTTGIVIPCWDGIDHNETNSKQITLNITVDADDEEY